MMVQMMIMMSMMTMMMIMMVMVVVMVMNGVDELTIHSNMCVHECARLAMNWPSWPAK
jgi:hypothetical protein